MLDRALSLDEAWGRGALHEFKIVLGRRSAYTHRRIGSSPTLRTRV